jgi:hypothetical protein
LVKVFKVFSDEELYKVIINYKKKKICETFLSNNSSVPSLVFENRFKKNKIEKNFFNLEDQKLLKSYINNYFDLFSTKYTKEEELLMNQNIETKEYKFNGKIF